jgi:chromate transporter
MSEKDFLIKSKNETENLKAESRPLVAPPNLWTVFRIWAAIGSQSFGGGPSTVFLIRREFINKRGWLSEEEYARFWVLCQLTPGINLISLTVLVGKKLGGFSGILVSMAGMLLPSCAITTLLAAGFRSVQDWPPAQAILKGVQPATAGLMMVVAVQFAVPLLKKSQAEGRISLGLTTAVVLACAALVGLLKLPVAFVLVGAGVVGAVAFGRIISHQKEKA